MTTEERNCMRGMGEVGVNALWLILSGVPPNRVRNLILSAHPDAELGGVLDGVLDFAVKEAEAFLRYRVVNNKQKETE